MKNWKRNLLIPSLIFLFFASGCSKSILQPDYSEPFRFQTGNKTCVGDCKNILFPGDGTNPLLPYRTSDRLQDLHFSVDRFDLDGKLKAVLEKNAAYLKAHPESRIAIEGYSDERGSNNYNVSLGQRRAQSVKSYLILLGVEKNRIQTISYGEEKPFCRDSTEECWYQNRRARFLVAE